MKYEWVAWVLLAPVILLLVFVAFWIYHLIYAVVMVLGFLAAIFAGYAYV